MELEERFTVPENCPLLLMEKLEKRRNDGIIAPMANHVIHISEAEAASNFPDLGWRGCALVLKS